MLEAMACGCPVIAPNIGGIPEILDEGLEGYLVSDRKPSNFAEKCEKLWENTQLIHRMSEAAWIKVNRSFSIESMVQGYLNLYRRLLNGFI